METFGNPQVKNLGQIFYCNICDFKCKEKNVYDKHILNGKHKMPLNGNFCQLLETFGNEKGQKGQKGQKINCMYYCQKCDYTCYKKYAYERHTASYKHIYKMPQKEDENVQKGQNGQNDNFEEEENFKFECVCGKKYKNKSGLWKHKNKCIQVSKSKNQIVEYEDSESSSDNKQNTMLYNLVIEVLKQNKELVSEVCKSSTNTSTPQNSIVATTTTNDSHNSHNNIQNNLVDSYNTTTNTTNNQNNTFNLQVFLNEKCKNAMNIMDFVDSLEPQLSDLESIGKLGFVNGLSNIIIKNLKALDVTMRPVHCNDSKRETVYVKDNDEWEKDDENKSKLRKAVKYIAHKNVKLVPQWKAKYPDYLDSSSANSDKYNNMVIEVLGGEDDSNISENKIMRKIVREVVIDKHIKL